LLLSPLLDRKPKDGSDCYCSFSEQIVGDRHLEELDLSVAHVELDATLGIVNGQVYSLHAVI
jgi:hypothetical protein